MYVVMLQERFDNHIYYPVFANSSKRECEKFISKDALKAFKKFKPHGTIRREDVFNGNWTDAEILESLRNDYLIFTVKSKA